MRRDFLSATIPAFPRIDDWSGAWWMEAQAIQDLRESLAHVNWQTHMAGPSPQPNSAIEMLEGKGGKSIAMIRATGLLMKSQPSMGGTSTIRLRRDIRSAANDPNVSGILLAIDSPGGTVAGTWELGNEVKAAGKQKPTWAWIEDLGASAAYWMASQANMVLAGNPMAGIGSIGTYWTLYDVSAAMEADGVKTHHFTTGPLKGMGVFGTKITDEQAAHAQGLVNGMQVHFDAAVRSGRNMSAKELATVRSGGVFPAAEAIGLKLIDGIKSLDATVKALASAR